MLNELRNINFEEFHFLRPEYLWLLIPLAIVFLLGILALREQLKFKKLIAPHLRPYMINKGSEGKRRMMHILLSVMITLAVLGSAGPSWERIEIPGRQLETPFIILLDLSQSMMADDIQPSRLERAKFKISDLLDSKPGARTALIGFSGTAHTIVPLTTDYKIIKSHLPGLKPSIMPFPGTDLETALALADSTASVTTAPARVLIISDDFGEEEYKLISSWTEGNENKLEIMPVNTVTGADIPRPRNRGSFKDKEGKPVHSSLQQDIISRLHSIERINVNYLTLDKSDMQLLARSVRENLEFREKDQEKEDDWKDKGIWLVLPFAFLVLIWFRKGWVLYSIILFTLSSCSYKPENFSDLWYTPDYQAQRLMNRGEYEGAAKLYSDELHRGVAYYKAGNYDEAIRAFSRDTSAMGAYNLGLAYYKSGDYAAASLAFGIAAEMDPGLEETAMANRQKMESMKGGTSEIDPDKATEEQAKPQAENTENKDQEDLGGGGQEATKEDMEKERKEETVTTDVRKGKELEEVPDDLETGPRDENQKIIMQKVDDDPALFLKRKFIHQAKNKGVRPKKGGNKW